MGHIRFMKDLFGEKIEVGDYVLYMISASSRHFEKGIIVESEEEFVKIEYLGESTVQLCYRRQKGKKGRLTATDKKVIVIGSGSMEDRNIYEEARKRFEEETRKVKSKLTKALQMVNDFAGKNELLQAEVEKINNPWDILDL